MGEDGGREDGEEGDGEREAAWREEGDRLRSMAGGVKQDPGRSCEEDRESGEEGGDGKVVHCSRGCLVLTWAQIEEGQLLFPSIAGPCVRPEGSFRSSGSSTENIAADYCY